MTAFANMGLRLGRPLGLTLLAVVLLWVAPAEAHHPMGGRMPETMLQGLLSGLGHPVIGPDHLAFIVAIGVAAAFLPAGLSLIAAFVAASTAGVLFHVAKLDVPLAEQMVAISVVGAGAFLALGRAGSQPLWLALGAVAGLFHGFAFGEAVVGAERAVIGSYLAGIAIVASVIAFGLMQFVIQVLRLDDATARHIRTAGLMIGCIGIVMLAGSLA